MTGKSIPYQPSVDRYNDFDNIVIKFHLPSLYYVILQYIWIFSSLFADWISIPVIVERPEWPRLRVKNCPLAIINDYYDKYPGTYIEGAGQLEDRIIRQIFKRTSSK